MIKIYFFFLKKIQISVGVDVVPTSKQIHKPNESSVGVTKKQYVALKRLDDIQPHL